MLQWSFFSQHDGERRSAEKRNKTKVAFVPVHEKKSNSLKKRNKSEDNFIFDSRSEGNTTEASTGDSSTDQDVHKGVSEDEVEDQKPFYLRFVPPPYLKNRPIRREENVEEPRKVKENVEEPRNVKENVEEPRKVTENDESNKQQAKPTTEEKPKPRSVRRRNVKPQPQPAREINIDDVGSSATNFTDIGSSRNKGKETMLGEEKGPGGDDEESMLDGLLMRYSKKKTGHESNKAKCNLKYQRQQEKDNADDSLVPTRAVSLPIDSNEPTEPVKKHTRTNSFVHPKLPDYDQLAARIAALKQK